MKSAFNFFFDIMEFLDASLMDMMKWINTERSPRAHLD